MSIQQKISEDLKAAMKQRDSARVLTLRMINAQMKDFRISKGSDLDREDELNVLTNAAKKRKEAIKLYEKSDRKDLLEKEQLELEIISSYLPAQLSEQEIETVILRIIEDVGAKSMQDIGKVMSAAMQELKGKADGKLVQEITRRKLN